MTERARFAALTCGVAILTIYGSLYPFRFHACSSLLLSSRVFPLNRVDFLSNVLLYVPLGFFGARMLGAAKSSVPVATLLAALLSFLIEAIQGCVWTRVPSLADVAANTLGALLGSLMALQIRFDYEGVLIFCWLGSRLFPYTPSGHFAKYLSAIRAVARAPAPLDVFKFFALWLAASVLLDRKLILAVAAVIFGRILIIDDALSSAELAGAILAAIVSFCLSAPLRNRVAAIMISIYVIATSLEPFHFLPVPRNFGWIPFLSFMEAPRESASRVFLEKSFMYGMLVWLPVRAGMRFDVVTPLAIALVFALRLIQVYLPNRSAEITDALMVLMLAGTMKLMQRKS